MVDYLRLDDLLRLARDLGVDVVRDVGLLDSAAHRPRTTAFGEDAYPDVTQKAAVLMESIVRNHALVDGNKRLGWHAMFTFLHINGVELVAPDDDAYDLVIGVAEGRIGYEESARTLARWSRPAPR